MGGRNGVVGARSALLVVHELVDHLSDSFVGPGQALRRRLRDRGFISALACSKVTWGGMGGSSGVVIASTITGRSAANASVNAPSIWSERS